METESLMSAGNLFEIGPLRKKFSDDSEILYLPDEGGCCIKRRAMTFVTGKSGIGKSTLFNLMSLMSKISPFEDGEGKENAGLRFYPEIKPRFMKTDCFDYGVEQKRRIKFGARAAHIRGRYFGILPQHGHLMQALSVRENLDVIYRLRKGRPSVRPIDELLEDLIKKVQAADVLKPGERSWDNSPATLSGGEAQRMALLRALLCDPPVMFVDEPTTYLDEGLIPITMELLYEQVREKGCSVIIITHAFRDLMEHAKNGLNPEQIHRLELHKINGDRQKRKVGIRSKTID